MVKATLWRAVQVPNMAWLNSRTGYGWLAIGLHWITAAGVLALYLLGERMEEAADRATRLEARNLHVSVGVMLATFLLARLLSSVAQPAPASLEPRPVFRVLGRVVQGLFLAMIAVLVLTGPLAVWSTGRPIEVFDLFSAPSPFNARIEWLHEAAEEAHGAATWLFWPLVVLHVGGAMKHLLLDRDRTMQRILWVRRPGL